MVSDEQPNAVLEGGPTPSGSRHMHAKPSTKELRAQAADGSGEHVWTRTGRFEPRAGGGLLCCFVYAGPAADVDSAGAGAGAG